MDYNFKVLEFEGPLDLLLHLVKKDNINICDISVEKIANQYLDYIDSMERMNLNIASEYLVVASELVELKSRSLLPKHEVEDDPKEELINRLLIYESYKNMIPKLKKLEDERKKVYTKEVGDLKEFCDDKITFKEDATLNDLIEAFSMFLKRKDDSKPLNTITKKEYSVSKRSDEIRNLIRIKKIVTFNDLFDFVSKDYVIVTFLSILDLARKQEIEIKQDNNFNEIILTNKECL